MLKWLVLLFSFSTLICDEEIASVDAKTTPLAEYVYIQQSKSGELHANKEGTYDLTLKGNHLELIYFADQPQRIAGSEELSPFFGSWPASEQAKPPTAFINYTDFNAYSNEGVTPDILELESPTYDPETDTVTFKAMPLHDHEISEGAFENVVIIYDKD